MKVEIAERRQKRIRLAERENAAAWIMDFQAVLEDLSAVFQHQIEKPGLVTQHRAPIAVISQQKYCLGIWAIGTNNHPAIGRMDTENRMRILMAQCQQTSNFLARDARNFAIG